MEQRRSPLSLTPPARRSTFRPEAPAVLRCRPASLAPRVISGAWCMSYSEAEPESTTLELGSSPIAVTSTSPLPVRSRPHACLRWRAQSSPARLLAAACAELVRARSRGGGTTLRRRARHWAEVSVGEQEVRCRLWSGRRGGSSTNMAMTPGAAVARASTEARGI
jgi:hypothetical protein